MPRAMTPEIGKVIDAALAGYTFSAKQLADPMAAGWYLYVGLCLSHDVWRHGVRPSHMQTYMEEQRTLKHDALP